MKCKDNDLARRSRARAVLAYPAVSVALVASAALVMTSFAPSAFADAITPTATATATPSTTASATAGSTATSAPTATPTPAPASAATPKPAEGAATTPSSTSSAPAGSSPVAGPSPKSLLTQAGVPVDHHVLAWVEGSGLKATYFPVDAAVLNASQFQTLRVRFRMHNSGPAAITRSPRLEYRPVGGTDFTVVPEGALKGTPLQVVREWVPDVGGGTKQGPLEQDIAVANFLTGKTTNSLAVIGHHSMGANPDQPVTLPADSFTEQEFTVRLTMDARYLTGYELRVTDGTVPMPGTQPAQINLGRPAASRLSPGQRQGIAVTAPRPQRSTGARPATTRPSTSGVTSAASAFPAILSAKATAIPAAAPPSTLRYPLVAHRLSAAAIASTDIHGPYSVTSDQCGICHRGHAAQAPNLLATGSQSALCLTCHNGTGANANVQAQYALARPVNNPATREYYSHDALAPSKHTRSELNEFGALSNRHSECADCHNSHKARSTEPAQTADGWESSGKLAGISGVSVVNGAADTAPTYTFLDGVNTSLTREYQLCFKCHSGFTTLTSNAGLKPSQYALDKGAELNPNNPSFHPVEAAGTNQSAKMAENLAGTSPYKLWNFTPSSTIRCLNCHASGTTPDTTPSPLPQPGTALAPHTSTNRGILLKNYRDRVLTSSAAAYSAGDFALCYVCHGEEPYANETSNATNFSLHGKHLTGLADKGSGGTDIDTPGAGQGNAICAECHFRLHSTTNKVGTQTIPGTRLVNFAPNVQPAGGTISWTPTITGSGSCTLTCHGYEHTGRQY